MAGSNVSNCTRSTAELPPDTAYNRRETTADIPEAQPVKLLEKFEQSMERLIEGTTGSLFNQPLQPADIGRRLERTLESGKVASVGSTIVPNLYTVGLNPADYQQMQGYAAGLARQMEAHLAREASDRGYSMIARIQVQIIEDPDAKKRRPNVRGTISDQQPSRGTPQSPGDATSMFRPAGTERSASLRGLNGPYQGRTFIVPPGVTTVGRAPDNDMVLECQDVSRRHARIESGPNGVRVHDINSTNGTRVNGEPVSLSDLDANDEVTFGQQRFRIEFHGNRR